MKHLQATCTMPAAWGMRTYCHTPPQIACTPRLTHAHTKFTHPKQPPARAESQQQAANCKSNLILPHSLVRLPKGRQAFESGPLTVTVPANQQQLHKTETAVSTCAPQTKQTTAAAMQGTYVTCRQITTLPLQDQHIQATATMLTALAAFTIAAAGSCTATTCCTSSCSCCCCWACFAARMILIAMQ